MDKVLAEQAVDVNGRSLDDSSDSHPRVKDTHVYSLLFTECDSDQSGWANVDDLILFIKKVLSSSSEVNLGADETDESDGSSAEADYNLDLLHRMLDCHAVQGLVSKGSYNQVIDKWVQDVRSSSPSSGTSHDQEEEDDVQDEEELPSQHDSYSACVGGESFETTGGGGASASEIDGSEVIASLEVENKRLVDRNQSLQSQMEIYDEQMRSVQIENRELQSKVKSQQQGLALLDAIKAENDDLASALQQEQKECLEMKTQIENLQQEIRELNSEVSELQNLLTHSNDERYDLEQQAQALQHQLLQKESTLKQAEEERQSLQVLVERQQFETANLTDALANTSETVQELKNENSQLQSSLSQHKTIPFPVSSTPFRPLAPSLQEELIQSGLSPFPGENGSMCLEMNESVAQEPPNQAHGADDFASVLAKAKKKVKHHTEKLERGLSEIIDGPLGGAGIGDKSQSRHGPEFTENYSEVFESKLTKLQQSKRKEQERLRKLREEVKELRKQNEQLRKECVDLQSSKEEFKKLKEQGIMKEEHSPDSQDIARTKHLANGRDSSVLCVGEDELVVEGRPPASTISLVNALVRTDPVLPLAPQPVLLPPINANEVEIQLIKSSPAPINLAQPSSDIPEHTPYHEEAVVSIQSKGPGAGLEDRNGDTSCDDYPSTSDSHLTTSSPPAVVSSGSGSAADEDDVDACRMHHAPDTANDSGSPVHLVPSSEMTSETVTAARPTSSLRLSHDPSLNPPSPTDLEPIKVKDGTGQETPAIPSLVQDERDEDSRVCYQFELVKPITADVKVQTNLTFARDEPDLPTSHHVSSLPEPAQFGVAISPLVHKGGSISAESSTSRHCLSRLGRAVYSLLKGILWLMLLLLLITTLFLVLIEFNGILHQCGGRVCRHAFFHMLLGQNLRYIRNGTVAM